MRPGARQHRATRRSPSRRASLSSRVRRTGGGAPGTQRRESATRASENRGQHRFESEAWVVRRRSLQEDHRDGALRQDLETAVDDRRADALTLVPCQDANRAQDRNRDELSRCVEQARGEHRTADDAVHPVGDERDPLALDYQGTQVVDETRDDSPMVATEGRPVHGADLGPVALFLEPNLHGSPRSGVAPVNAQPSTVGV